MLSGTANKITTLKCLGWKPDTTEGKELKKLFKSANEIVNLPMPNLAEDFCQLLHEQNHETIVLFRWELIPPPYLYQAKSENLPHGFVRQNRNTTEVYLAQGTKYCYSIGKWTKGLVAEHVQNQRRRAG